MRRDPNAQKVGAGSAEGKAAQRVVSDVPSRREMAGDVVQKMVERLARRRPAHADRLRRQAAPPRPRRQPQRHGHRLASAIQELGTVGGGGTAIGKAFESVRDILAAIQDSPRTRKLVLLTDGEDQEPNGRPRRRQIGRLGFPLPIVAFGTGECKVAFLTELAKTSLAGAFNHIRDETAAQQLFGQAVKNQKNIQATNVQLQLWLSPEIAGARALSHQAGDSVRRRSAAGHTTIRSTLRLEQMERGKAYEFLFRCSLPGRPADQRFRIAKATLTCDVPSLNKTAGKAGDEHRRRIDRRHRPRRRALRRRAQGAGPRRGATAGAVPARQDRPA